MGWQALAGAVAGGQKDAVASYNEGATTSAVNLRNFDDINKGSSGLEQAGYNNSVSGFADLQNLLSKGPGANEVAANNAFQNSYADQLQGIFNSAANPNQQANFQEAQKYFAPQQTALNQQFQDANRDSNRLAARLGRAGNDPILRNKLMQEQTRQQTTLNSQIGTFGQQMPQFKAQQLMSIGNGLSNVRGGLATQAFQNRQALMGMGQQLTAAERQYRLETANRTGSSYSHGEQLSGGGTKGVITGAQAGQGAEMQQVGSIFGAIGGGVMSDRRAKTGIVSATAEIRELLNNIRPYEFQYKDTTLPGTAGGKRYGVMAQDLEQSAAGRSIVIETPQGKMVDTAQGFGTVLAALSDIHQRLKNLESK